MSVVDLISSVFVVKDILNHLQNGLSVSEKMSQDWISGFFADVLIMMTSRTNLKSSGLMNFTQDSMVLSHLLITGGRTLRKPERRLVRELFGILINLVKSEDPKSRSDSKDFLQKERLVSAVKGSRFPGRASCNVYFYTCEMCNIEFASSKKKACEHIFCSKSCSHSYDKSLKMDTLDYNKVKDLYESGVTQVKIAKMFGVSNATVSKFMRDNGISTGYKRHNPGLKRKSRRTSNADVV